MTFRYDFAPTPFGDALAVFSDDGIVRFDLSESADPQVPWLLEGVSRQLGAVPEPVPGAADALVPRLEAYVDGEPVRVGAVLAGHPGAARAVGTACRLTPFSLIVPVHRVVRSDGSAGHYGGHPERKRFLLDLESR